MPSIRHVSSCIGSSGNLSVLGQLFGLARGQVPPDRGGGSGAQVTISVLAQALRLEQALTSPNFGDHFHVNIIRFGSDRFQDTHFIEIDYSICRLRAIYAGGLGVGRVQHWDVTSAQANGLDTPTTRAQLQEITEKWEVRNNGIDVFFPFAFSVPNLLGLAPVPGPSGDKDPLFGMEAVTTGLWGVAFGDDQTARSFAHEIGHYLGEEHTHDDGECPPAGSVLLGNLMTQSRCVGNNVRTAVALGTKQLSDMQAHDFVFRNCSPDVPPEDGPEVGDVAGLRDVLAGRTQDMTREAALSRLRSKVPLSEDDVAAVRTTMATADESARVRYQAALDLGRVGTSAAREALESSLDVDDGFVLRGIVRSLGHVGDRAALQAIRQVRHRVDVRSQADWAVSLLAYRLREPGDELGFPERKDLLGVERGRAAEIQIQAVDAQESRQAITDVAKSNPHLRLSAAGGVGFRCGARQLLYLWNAEVASREAIRGLRTRKGLLGVVVELFSGEGEQWAIDFYFFAQPGTQEGIVELLGVTTTGTVVLAGLGEFEGDRVHFRLQTVEHPGAVPFDFEGVIDDGHVRFERALAGRRRVEKLAPEEAPSSRRR